MMVVRSVAGDRILVASLDRCVYEWLRILEDTALGLRTLRDHVVSYNLNKTYSAEASRTTQIIKCHSQIPAHMASSQPHLLHPDVVGMFPPFTERCYINARQAAHLMSSKRGKY